MSRGQRAGASGARRVEEIMALFSCLGQRPQQQGTRGRIDRSMIGYPTDFKHTGHIGAGDMCNATHLNSIEGQMRSKGGFDHVSPVQVTIDTVDLPTTQAR